MNKNGRKIMKRTPEEIKEQIEMWLDEILQMYMTGIKKSITRNIGLRICGRVGFIVRNLWILWNILNWTTYIK